MAKLKLDNSQNSVDWPNLYLTNMELAMSSAALDNLAIDAKKSKLEKLPNFVAPFLYCTIEYRFQI